MPLNSGSKRPASRACNGPARSAIHDASSAGSAHVAILGPPVNDGARMQTPSWPKGLFHAKINSDQKDSEHSFFQKVQIMATRDEFSLETKRVIAARVGFRCSHPECDALTVGP